MEYRNNHRKDAEDYRFINEIIKEKPADKQRIVKRLLFVAGSGALFGICAAVSIVVLLPSVLSRVGNAASGGEDAAMAEITLAPVEDGPEVSADTDLEETADSGEEFSAPTPLENYRGTYEEVLRIAEEPARALVELYEVSSDQNLLDHSVMSYGDTSGVIFYKSSSHLYILAMMEDQVNMDRLYVTFPDGETYSAQSVGYDGRTGLMTVRVPLSGLSEETSDSISVARIGDSDSLLQAEPVIAVGSPAGDPDAVVYGMITSVSGKFSVTDAEYNVLATDMRGSENGSGILLDTSGRVAGLIVQIPGSSSNVVRAVSMAQLRPLVEDLLNKREIKYLGIYGTGISGSRAEALSVPEGIYVNRVENDSPAMHAGIQSGDIIHSLDGEPVTDMQAYSEKLQSLNAGERKEVVIYRRSADGYYAEMKFHVVIEQK